jgi:hypothetical protein
VAADGVRAGVQPLPGQLLAKPDDLLLHGGRHRPGAGVRASRARLERRLALREVAPNQLLDPVPGDLVVAGDLALGAPSTSTTVMISRALDMAGHLQKRRQLCPGTGANYVLKPDTAPATKSKSQVRGRFRSHPETASDVARASMSAGCQQALPRRRASRRPVSGGERCSEVRARPWVRHLVSVSVSLPIEVAAVRQASLRLVRGCRGGAVHRPDGR